VDLLKSKPTQLGHAQHFDVPTPVTFIPTTQSSRQEGGMIHDFMQYAGKLTISQATTFYKQEMERTGWDVIDLSGANEGFLFCSKPHKQCGVQVRANTPPMREKPTTVCLFITSPS
jgi:hypothetical protein